MSQKKPKVYKTPVGAVPKIVNNFKPKTENQKLFHNKISDFNNQLILCHGIAGTGKTYVSIYKALQDILRRGTPYDKLIIINPTVDVGNEDKLGFLPGELQAKIQQYNESTFTILDKIIGKARAGKMIADNKIEIGVLNFLRGTNLENCYVILDEAQNVSPMQIKTLMTRISENCKMIIQGDMSQCDKYKTNGVTNYEKSGFYDVWFRLKDVDGVEHMSFTRDDCVRHPLVKRILKTYEDEHEIDLEVAK
jgi:phosphate starvation-inducible PhoH-like protein